VAHLEDDPGTGLMAGHRREHGRPKRSTTRAQMMTGRMALAATPEARLTAAFDWFRSAAVRDGKRRESTGLSAAFVREVTDLLIARATAMEGRRGS
jgi:hypothetical protein